MRTRSGARLLALAGLTFMLAACGQAAASHPPAPGTRAARVVVLDQAGRGYAATRLFKINPQKPWGVAYAYSCGAHAGDFAGDVWEVVNAVELPYTLFSAHETGGRGLHMETGSTSTINAPNGSAAGSVLGLRIKSTCAWHVRVVAGTKRVVRGEIPSA
jgi:hypothetical protein